MRVGTYGGTTVSLYMGTPFGQVSATPLFEMTKGMTTRISYIEKSYLIV